MFKFRLEFLLKYKRRLEEEEMLRLAEKTREADRMEAELKELGNHTQEIKKEAGCFAGEVNAPLLGMYSSYINELRKINAREQVRLQRARKQQEAQREQLVRAAKERKTLERLKEIHKARHQNEENRKEREFFDEMATLRAGRQKK